MNSHTPSAWLGYTCDRKMVRVCAWCPDKVLADALAHEIGLSVTHTACKGCYAEQMRVLRG